MDHHQEITVCPITWDTQASTDLNGIGGLDADDYQQMKETDNVDFYAVYEGITRVASVVLRFEQHMRGHVEAVLVAGAGKAMSDLTLLAIPHFERIAAARGAKSFRLHTERPGLVRKLARRAASHEVSLRWELV